MVVQSTDRLIEIASKIYCPIVNFQGMLDRNLQLVVQKALSRVPAVALLGPRQVGKTTLAKTIAKSYQTARKVPFFRTGI